MTKRIDPIQAVVDAGSSQIRVTIGICEEQQPLEIIACSMSNDGALKHGVISNISDTTQALRQAIDEAERQSGVEIRNVDVSFGGAQVAGINADGSIQVRKKHITKEDIVHVIEQARLKIDDAEHQILHVLEQEYLVDEHEDIHEPLGMMADKLEIYAHILRAERSACENLQHAITAAGVGVNSIVFSGLASGYAATTQDARQLGVCVVDIGAGTTDFIVWQDNMPLFSGGLKIGGENISSQLATKLLTPRQFAEILKCEQGAISIDMMRSPHIELPSTGWLPSKYINSNDIVDVIAAGYSDIFTSLEQALYRQGMRKMVKAGLVLTGGATKIPGLETYIKGHFSDLVRIACPDRIAGLPEHLQNDPSMMTSIGLLKLLYEPIADHIWVKLGNKSIITQIKNIFTRYF